MKLKLILLVVVLIAISACKDTRKETAQGLKIGIESVQTPVSNNLYEDLEGNPVELSDFKGKRILLNFWATWCRPCIEEMPSLLKSKTILEKENYVFLLATDQSTEKIKSFIERKNFDFNYIRLTGSFAQLKIQALPVTFIYNEKGEKVDEISGAIAWDSPEIIERLKNID